MRDVIIGLTTFLEEEHVENSQNMSKISYGSISDLMTQSITINSTGVVSTDVSKT